MSCGSGDVLLLLHVRRLLRKVLFAAGLQLFSDSSNADFVVFCNTIGYCSSLCRAFEDFWTAWVPGTWELHSVLAQLTHEHLSSQQATVTLFSMYWICVDPLTGVLHSELQALVIATRLHIRHLT